MKEVPIFSGKAQHQLTDSRIKVIGKRAKIHSAQVLTAGTASIVILLDRTCQRVSTNPEKERHSFKGIERRIGKGKKEGKKTILGEDPNISLHRRYA